MSVDKLKQEKEVAIKWLHFPLHPETPPEGILMKDLYRNRNREEAKAYGDHLRSLMAEAGLEYNKRTRLDNSRIAQELGAWADTRQSGDEFHYAMFRAYFVDDRTISDPDTLIDIAGSVGLDQAQAREVIESRSFSPRVTRDWDRAWENGITGVPTFAAQDLFVYGCQPYEVLERFYNNLAALQSSG